MEHKTIDEVKKPQIDPLLNLIDKDTIIQTKIENKMKELLELVQDEFKIEENTGNNKYYKYVDNEKNVYIHLIDVSPYYNCRTFVPVSVNGIKEFLKNPDRSGIVYIFFFKDCVLRWDFNRSELFFEFKYTGGDTIGDNFLFDKKHFVKICDIDDPDSVPEENEELEESDIIN